MKHADISAADCAIAQALGVIGDWWTPLVIRAVAGGSHRFDGLQRELRISRKVLTGRLKNLVEHDVLERRRYTDRPPRHDYHLTDSGKGLLPVLVALQDWGTRHMMGDGSLTATSSPASLEARHVHQLVGKRVVVDSLTASDGRPLDPVGGTRWTVLYCFAVADAPGGRGYPPGWVEIPGATGCTMESITYRKRHEDFVNAGATVRGVSTQRPDELAWFAAYAGLPFALLSDTDLSLIASLRLPTFRAAGVDRLKRLTLVIDQDRSINAVLFPVTDPVASVEDAFDLVQGS